MRIKKKTKRAGKKDDDFDDDFDDDEMISMTPPKATGDVVFFA